MDGISWEILVGAGIILMGQGGLIEMRLRRYINGLGIDVAVIKKDTTEEIKPGIKTLLEGQYKLGERVSLVERDITYLKDEC